MDTIVKGHLSATQEMLAKHHRHGSEFAELIKKSYSNRFNQAFWTVWENQIAPSFGDSPLVLDIGTGSGNFLVELGQRYPTIRSIGIECADYMLQAMEKLPDRSEIITADLHDPDLSVKDNSVDAVVASAVIHEMIQPIKTFNEMFRCLKPGGLFYILDWVRVPLQQYFEEDSEVNIFDVETDSDTLQDLFQHFYEHNRFTGADLLYLLQQVGFETKFSEPLHNGRQVRILVSKPQT